MKIENPTQLRSGMIFDAGHGSYMIVSNDMGPESDNWREDSKWIVIWFINSKNDPDSVGFSFHGSQGHEPRNLENMFGWVAGDEMIYYIDKDVLAAVCKEAGINL